MTPERVKIGGVIELAETPPQRVEDASVLLLLVICAIFFLGAVEKLAQCLDQRRRL